MNRPDFRLLFIVLSIIFLNSCKDDETTLATVTTTEINGIGYEDASGGGEILSDGGGAVVARGICWSTTEKPTIENDTTLNGGGQGIFSSELTDLAGSTTYFVRAYAINEAGVAYGQEVTFVTSPTPTLPIVSTAPVSAITSSGASCGGSVNNAGNSLITAKGVCWGTSPAPTIEDNITEDGSGTEQFVSTLSELQPGTTYYVRAYATNEVGTGYGNELSFSTNSIIATIYATKDASIFNTQAGTSPNGNYGSGGSELLQVGYASPSLMYARTLVQFDLSSIPTDAVIESVQLEFTLGSSGSFVPVIYVHKLNQNWTEGITSFCTYNNPCNTQGIAVVENGGDVTWNESSYSGTLTNTWTTSGGTFAEISSAVSTDVGASTVLYVSESLKNDVSQWVQNGTINFGWILKTDFITNTSAMRRFLSREGASASGNLNSAPRLIVTYH